MFFTPLLPGGVIGTDTGTLRRQVKVKRKTQPNQSMTIDWSNPITKGLIFAYNGVTNTDLVKGSRGDQQNIAVDSIGQGTNISASLDAVTINNVNNLPTTNNLSLFSLFTTTVSPAAQSATSYYAGVFSKRTTNNTRGPAIFFGGGTLLFTSNNSVGTNTDTTLSGSITSTGRTTICVTGSLSGSVGYVNGKQTGTGIVPYWPANTDPWYIGIIATPGPTTAYLSAVHHLDLCWNRTLTAAEVSSLNANPWQLFKSTPQTMVATRGIVSRPNSDLSVTNNTITIRRQIKVKRKTQPNQSMTIDWSNPIANGLIFAYNGVTNTDLVKGARGDKQNIAVDSIGQGTNITGSADVVTISARNNTPVTNNLSFFSLFTTTVSPATQSATNYYGSLFCKRDSINPERISFYFASGNLHIVANDSLGVSQQITLSGDITSIGRTTACATGSINGSVGYINGKQTGTGIATYWPAGTSTWKIGLGRADAPTETLIAVHHLDLCWNRTLTAAEVASLNANPWQLFKSTPQTMVATRGIVSRPNSDLSVTNNTITIRRQIKVKRKTQPQMATQIDWSNPITKGLVKAMNAAASDPTVTLLGTSPTPLKVTSPVGIGYSANGGTSYWQASPTALASLNPTWTILTIVSNFNNAGNNQGGFGLYVERPNNTQIAKICVGQNQSFSQAEFTCRDLSNNLIQMRPSYGSGGGPIVSDGKPHVMIFTRRASNNHRGWIDGVERVFNTAVNINGAFAATNATIGVDPFDVVTFNGSVPLVIVWKRSLSDKELQSISANPWQIFKSTPQTIVSTKSGWSYNSNTSLYDAIDEPSYNDTDAIISPNLNASPEPAKFGLDTSLDAGTYNVNVRARRTDTTGDIRATLINSAGNVVGTSSWQTLTANYQTYVLSVTTTATASRVGLEVRA